MLVAVMLFLFLQSPSEGKTSLRKPEFRLAAPPVHGGAVAGREQVPRACCQDPGITVTALPDPLPSREGSPGTGEDAASADTSSRLKDISSLFLCSV